MDRAPDFTCTGCGNRCPDDDTGCLTCDTCTPAAGNCYDCRDLRTEDAADWWQRYANETPEVPC